MEAIERNAFYEDTPYSQHHEVNNMTSSHSSSLKTHRLKLDENSIGDVYNKLTMREIELLHDSQNAEQCLQGPSG